MVSIKLKVSPDKMKATAEEIKGQAETIKKNWEHIQNVVQQSDSYWEGEAGKYHRKYLKDKEDDVQKIIRRLNEHPKDLLSMAGIYTKAEMQAKKATSALPSDVIK